MFKKFVLVCCFVLSCAPAHSGVKEHRALAEELIKITDGDTVMEKMKAQVTMIFQQITAQMNVQEADKPKLEEYSKRFDSIIKDNALPRKTFSMGEAHEKRYYMEARKIQK